MSIDNEYMRVYMLDRYYRRKAAAIGRLGGRCVDCGVDQELEFDHVDPATKSFTIGNRLSSVAEHKLQAELEKCVLRCRGCHIAKSRAEGSLSRPPANKILNPEHGTGVMYARERCRCELCRAWKRLHRDPATRVAKVAAWAARPRTLTPPVGVVQSAT